MMLATAGAGSHVTLVREKSCAFRGGGRHSLEIILFNKASLTSLILRKAVDSTHHTRPLENSPLTSHSAGRCLHLHSPHQQSQAASSSLCNSSIDPSVPAFISKPTIVHVYVQSAN